MQFFSLKNAFSFPTFSDTSTYFRSSLTNPTFYTSWNYSVLYIREIDLTFFLVFSYHNKFRNMIFYQKQSDAEDY